MKKSKMYSRGKAVGGGRSNPLSVKPKQSKMASKAKRRSKKQMGGIPVGSPGAAPGVITAMPPRARRPEVIPPIKPGVSIGKMGGDSLGMSGGGKAKKSKMMSRGNIRGVSGRSEALGAKARKNSKRSGSGLSAADLRKLKSILKGIL